MTPHKLASLIKGVAAPIKEALALRDSKITAIETRLADLEACPAVKWAGPYADGKSYAGSLVQRSGLWLCTRATATKPGTDPASWRLLVKQQ